MRLETAGRNGLAEDARRAVRHREADVTFVAAGFVLIDDDARERARLVRLTPRSRELLGDLW